MAGRRFQFSLTANSGTVLSLPQAQKDWRLRGNWGGLVGDARAFGHVAEQHIVRAGKCQENLVGGRAAARSMHDFHLRGLEEIRRLHHLIEALDRVFDRQHPGVVGRMQRQPMVGVVESDEGGVADPVADAAVKQRRPQGLVGAVRGAAQRDRRKPGDAGVARGKIAPARGLRPHHQLEAVAAAVAKACHVPRFAAGERCGIPGRGRDSVRRQRGNGTLERRAGAQFQADRLRCRVPGLVHQGVVAKIGTEHCLFFRSLDQLQAENALCEIDCRRQIARAQAYITQLLDFDHRLVSVEPSPTTITVSRARPMSTRAPARS
jgi:hypothetical protein